MKKKTPEEIQQEWAERREAKKDRAVIVELIRKARERKALVSATLDGKTFYE